MKYTYEQQVTLLKLDTCKDNPNTDSLYIHASYFVYVNLSDEMLRISFTAQLTTGLYFDKN
jgi:hypothetical protein